MLCNFGFHEQAVDLFVRIVSSNWFSVLLNGGLLGFFKSSQGMRQRDPLSPALFVLVAEYLGHGIQHTLALKAN